MTLTERLQAARAGSRELSDEVLYACGWTSRPYQPHPNSWSSTIWRDPLGNEMSETDRPDPTQDMNAVLAMAGGLALDLKREHSGCCGAVFYGHDIYGSADGEDLCCVACAALLHAKGADNE